MSRRFENIEKRQIVTKKETSSTLMKIHIIISILRTLVESMRHRVKNLGSKMKTTVVTFRNSSKTMPVKEYIAGDITTSKPSHLSSSVAGSPTM